MSSRQSGDNSRLSAASLEALSDELAVTYDPHVPLSPCSTGRHTPKHTHYKNTAQDDTQSRLPYNSIEYDSRE